MKQKNKSSAAMGSMDSYLKRYYPKTHNQILSKSEKVVTGLGAGSAKESLKSFDNSFSSRKV